MRLTQIIEALLFASDAPLSAEDLSRVDERLDEDTVEAVIRELRAEYELSERSFQIYEVAGGFQLLTRPEFVSVLERYDSVPQPSRLSAPALEVLSIIAYRQPLGRAEIEDIRGVGSSGVLRTLVERDLVAPVGRAEGLGRPLLYGTTRKFLEHFGFRSLEDLPRPEELPVVLRERPAQPGPDADGTDATDETAASAQSEAASQVEAGAPGEVGAPGQAGATGEAPDESGAVAEASADDSGSDEVGPAEPGRSESGADDTPSDETGADETGADETGADETGADEAPEATDATTDDDTDVARGTDADDADTAVRNA